MSDAIPFELLPPSHKRADRHDPDVARAALEQRLQDLPKLRIDDQDAAVRYQVDEDLATAVNVALNVGAPLLVTGEPGTGKTQLAYHLAWYFGIPLYDYVVRSNCTAEDLKYEFDAVAYLRSAQEVRDNPKARPRPREKFLHKRVLWKAFESGTSCVVLIDEIDKAPRDFPNDLLQELAGFKFAHPFDPAKPVAADRNHRPIVVITSNEERRLPDAFLRRCVYHNIRLSDQLLETAVDTAIEHNCFPRPSPGVKEVALARFQQLRELDTLRKRPSTGELLAWISVLAIQGVTANQLDPDTVPIGKLPGLQALIKAREDLDFLDEDR